MVVIIEYIKLKLIKKFPWESGFLWGSMEPPYALTEVRDSGVKC